MLRRRCDRCGKSIPWNRQSDATAGWTTVAFYSINGADKDEADLCPDCSKQVRDFAMRYTDEEGEEL